MAVQVAADQNVSGEVLGVEDVSERIREGKMQGISRFLKKTKKTKKTEKTMKTMKTANRVRLATVTKAACTSHLPAEREPNHRCSLTTKSLTRRCLVRSDLKYYLQNVGILIRDLLLETFRPSRVYYICILDEWLIWTIIRQMLRTKYSSKTSLRSRTMILIRLKKSTTMCDRWQCQN